MDKETICLYLPAELVAWLKHEAQADNRTPSNWLTVRLRKMMDGEPAASEA